MRRYLNKLFTTSVLALLLPAYVSAASFSPTSDVDINLTTDTTFNFDSYTISPGINVSYLAPEDSLIEFFVDGDFIIDGALSLAGDATYSFTSNTGAVYLSGSGSVSLLGNVTLIINSGLLADAGDGAGAGSTSNSGGIILDNGSSLLTVTGTTISGLIPINPVILPPSPITTGFTLTLVTPVPVPPSLILFLTGLLGLSLKLKFHTKAS